MHRRRETWEWKNKLRRLNARKISLEGQKSGVAVAEALTAAKDYATALQNGQILDVPVQGIPVEPGLAEAIEERTAEVVDELESISKEIASLKQKLNEQFTDMHKYEYKLQTVFIHRGEAGGGHYWIYIYDFENDTWRKYNDDRVDVVSNRKEIFEPQKVVDGTPYYLAYVRSEDKQDLVQAVCRDVPEPMDVTDVWAGEMEDEGVVMEDNDDNAVRHVEHVKPRPLRPKPLPNASATNSWETDPGVARTDANGKPW
jgi:ubiquitin carboxyl-terminal hydrolase 25/28